MTTHSSTLSRFGSLRHIMHAALALSGAVIACAVWAQADQPNQYAQKFPITLNAVDQGLQRIVLPPQALVASNASGYADVRVFNAQGQPVPIALATQRVKEVEQRSAQPIKPYPILADAPLVAGGNFNLMIQESNGQRTVQVQGTDGKAASTGAQKIIVGALFDTRSIKDPVVKLDLDIALPPSQTVSLQVQASSDLKNWVTLADDAPVYKFVASAAPNVDQSAPIQTSIALNSATLEKQYLRITWPYELAKAGTVTLNGVSLVTQVLQQNAPARAKLPITLPAPANQHEVIFSLPLAAPLLSMHLTPAGKNELIPVQIYSRNDRTLPWQLVTSTVLFRMQRGGAEQVNSALSFGGLAVKEMRIVADAKTPGFSAAPLLTVELEPLQLIFLASGNPPFTLAVGNSAAKSVSLPIRSLMPDYKDGAEDALPLATAQANTSVAAAAVSGLQATPASAVDGLQAQGAKDSMPTRNVVLWGVLVLGVLVLGGMAWALSKQMKQTGANVNNDATPPPPPSA